MVTLRGVYRYGASLTRPVHYRSETDFWQRRQCRRMVTLRTLCPYGTSLTCPVRYRSETGFTIPCNNIEHQTIGADEHPPPDFMRNSYGI